MNHAQKMPYITGFLVRFHRFRDVFDSLYCIFHIWIFGKRGVEVDRHRTWLPRNFWNINIFCKNIFLLFIPGRSFHCREKHDVWDCVNKDLKAKREKAAVAGLRGCTTDAAVYWTRANLAGPTSLPTLDWLQIPSRSVTQPPLQSPWGFCQPYVLGQTESPAGLSRLAGDHFPLPQSQHLHTKRGAASRSNPQLVGAGRSHLVWNTLLTNLAGRMDCTGSLLATYVWLCYYECLLYTHLRFTVISSGVTEAWCQSHFKPV